MVDNLELQPRTMHDTLLDYYFLISKLALAVSTASSTIAELLDAKDSQQTVDHNAGVRDVLSTMKTVPSVFKILTNFSIEEFNELWLAVCPVIATHARSTGDIIQRSGRKPKSSPQQRLLNFILYLKHDDTTVFDAHQWNWAKSSVCDDTVFIASCVVHACVDEIRWPSPEERRKLGLQLPEFHGCIEMIDGTLCKIKRLSGSEHKKFLLAENLSTV